MRCDNCAKRENCRTRMEFIERMPHANIANCYRFKEDKPTPPMTNGDKIRAMTDEELLETIMRNLLHCPPGEKPSPNNCINGCRTCYENWLKQPAERED